MRRLLLVIALVAAGSVAWMFRGDLQRHIPALFVAVSPHARYEAWLRLRRLDQTPAGEAWIASARRAVDEPQRTSAPFERSGRFAASGGAAVAWAFPARRGHRVTIEVTSDAGRVFVDLFTVAGGAQVASAPGEAGAKLEYDADGDEELIVRLQPELERAGDYRLALRALASMTFPVSGRHPGAVQSGFGSARDAGRRQHQGVDIFAPRGTPVVAATDGWVGSSRSNTLGGNVVWLWSPLRGLSTYYAHLDGQAVAPGAYVRAGELVGWVGNTGNARTTPAHLHFGVYTAGHGAVDPLPFVCDAPCGGRFDAAGSRRRARSPGERALQPRAPLGAE